jgi:hypothetical protein
MCGAPPLFTFMLYRCEGVLSRCEGVAEVEAGPRS